MSTHRVLQLAGKYTKAGQYGLAEQEYQTLLARYPANARARAGLARLRVLVTSGVPSDDLPDKDTLQVVVHLLQQGRALRARDAAIDLVARYPDNPSVNQLAGLAWAACQVPDKAVQHYQRALLALPNDADTLFNLGNALNASGDPQAALEAYGRAIKVQPDYLKAYTNIGLILTDLGQVKAAETTFRQAMLLAPENAETHRNLGKLYYSTQRFREAATCFRQAHVLTPACADSWLELGNACFFDNQFEAAIKALQAAMDLRPDNVPAINSMACVMRSLGRMAQARALFEQVIKLNPTYCLAHYNLSTLKQYQTGDAQMQAMLALQVSEGLSDEAQMHLGFALAKAHQDIGDKGRSIACLETANRLQRRAAPYDIARDNNFFQTVRQAFAAPVPTLVPGKDCAAVNGTTPVFILGMPRSGTTLSEQILASHSDVHGAGELPFLARAIRQSGWKGGPPDNDVLHSIRRDYFQMLAGPDGETKPARFITDKMPLNFRLCGFILTALPEAKIIHVKRDARATCWSIYNHHFSERNNANGFACDQVELATYYRMYLSLMAFWQEKFPGQIYDLNYQALTENQEAETRALLDHTGLDWQAQCLDFQTSERAVRTASALQIRQKMYQGSSDNWREFAPFLKPMTDILEGY